jgi:hypothetical protein
MTPDRDDLVAAYAQKPVCRLLQLDGFTGAQGDCVIRGDEDGDGIMFGVTHELMRSPGRDMPVRLLIHEDADCEDVRRLLAKMLDGVINRGIDYLREEAERDLLARAGIEAEIPF